MMDLLIVSEHGLAMLERPILGFESGTLSHIPALPSNVQKGKVMLEIEFSHMPSDWLNQST